MHCPSLQALGAFDAFRDIEHDAIRVPLQWTSTQIIQGNLPLTCLDVINNHTHKVKRQNFWREFLAGNRLGRDTKPSVARHALSSDNVLFVKISKSDAVSSLRPYFEDCGWTGR